MAVRYGDLPFTEAIDFFRQKLEMPSERWADVWQDAHNRAFMVAGATKTDLLADFRQAVDAAIAEGRSLGWFRREFDTIVARHGWAHTGPSGWRAELVFDTNLRQAYNAGREVQIERAKGRRPYGLYQHGGSEYPRELHLSWHNLVLPLDHPWWRTHSPQNGYGCKCKKFTLSEAELKRRGLKVGPAPDNGSYEWVDQVTGEVHRIPRGIDPGFDYRPGSPEQLTRQVTQRLATKPPLAERLPERLVDSAWSTAPGMTARHLSDRLNELPAPVTEGLRGFLQAHPVKTLFLNQSQLARGKTSAAVAPAIADYLGLEPIQARARFTHPHSARVNGFTARSFDHVVVKVRATDKLAAVDMNKTRAAAARVIHAMHNNDGPRPMRRGAELIHRYWSVSDGVREAAGDTARALITWLHELGHQVHFYAGTPPVPAAMGAVTHYGGSNELERFAEWFAAWALARDELHQLNPELVDWIEAVLAAATANATKQGANP